MSKSLYVKITEGQSLGPYTIYYDVVQPSNYALLYNTELPATNIPLSSLTSGSGARVTVPDLARTIILQNANGDCLNYEDYAIVVFSGVTSACTGYYNGTATINISISGNDGLFQYSIDGGDNFTESTPNKTYSFTDLSNGEYNVSVKVVNDDIINSYASNPIIIDCEEVLSTSYSATCNVDQIGTITIIGYGGSGDYRYAIKNVDTGILTEPQVSNEFTDLPGTGTFQLYLYDHGNTVTPDYLYIAPNNVVFNCPAPLPPLQVLGYGGCGPNQYVGTGTLTASGFQGGTDIYIYASYGTTLQEATDNLNDVRVRSVIPTGATSYTWPSFVPEDEGGLTNGTYYIGLQDSGAHQAFVGPITVSCTVPVPPNQQFFAYNLAVNSCVKTGVGTKYWTYDLDMQPGYYSLNGGSTMLKLESTPTTEDKNIKITSKQALTCLSSYVTLTPMNNLPTDAYTLYVNNTPYPDFDSGTRSYPVGSVIKVVYNGVNNVCNVTLNGNSYASGTNVTILLDTDYTFILRNYNHWVDYGQPYCQDNQTRQNIINDCGNTSYRIITPCSTACTATTYTETCSGTYGQNVLRTLYYACNGQATGTTTTYTCGPCSSTVQDWVTESTYCKPGDCTKWNLQRQMNPCATAYNTTREIDTNVANCDCGESCLGTYEEQPFCDPQNPTTAIYVTKYFCFPNSVVSSRSVSCSPACNASTVQNWVNEGAVYCSSCVKKQLQRQVNPCAEAYNTTRTIDVSGITCECGESCLGTETYNFCGGADNKDLYTVQRYKCPPYNYVNTPSLIQTCASPTCTTLTATYTSQGYSACYVPPTGSNNCATGPVYKDTNRCSSTYNNYFIDINSTYYNVGGQPTAGTCNTTQIWTDTGNTRCNSCVNEKEQRQTNRCASGYDTTRWVAGGSACNYNANYSNAVGYVYSCSAGTVSSTVVYQNTNPCFTGNQWIVGSTTYATNPSQSYPNTDPVWADSGSTYCVFGDCTLYQNQINTNPCSSATTRAIDTGVVSNSCGIWQYEEYCYPAYGQAPYQLRSREVNSCTGDIRNDQFIANDSTQCGYTAPRDSFYVGTAENDPEFACTRAFNTLVYCYSGCSGGNPVYNSRIVYSATGNDPIANGFYHVFPDSWIEISGSDGVVSDTGLCQN